MCEYWHYWVLTIENWLLSNDCKTITISSYFSALETIKSKHRCLLSDESLESLLICAVSEIEPRFIQIIESSEFRISNKWINLIFAINQSKIKIFVNERCNFLICFTTFINNVILMIILINIITIHNSLRHELIILQMFK